MNMKLPPEIPKGQPYWKQRKKEIAIMERMHKATIPNTGWDIYQKINKFVNTSGDEVCSLMYKLSNEGYLVINGFDEDCGNKYELPKTKALIPLDDRYNDNRPKITNLMKSMCNGAFTILIDEPCPKCALHLDDHYDDVECLCGGNEEMQYQKEITVPWDKCKEIYKNMASIAIEEAKG